MVNNLASLQTIVNMNTDQFGLFSQLDPRWYRERLGETIYTIKEWGCTICAIAMMIFALLGKIVFPSELAKIFKFLSNGKLIWSSVHYSHGGKTLKFTHRVRNQRPSFSQMTKYANEPHLGMLLEINNGSHWVFLKKWSVFSLWWYLCGDPYKYPAKFIKYSKKKITGYATFELITE